MTLTTTDAIALLEQCDESAIGGEWTVRHDRVHHPMVSEPSDVYIVLDGDGIWVAECGADKGSADAIAALRNAAPAVAECLREMAAENERIAGLYDEACAASEAAENERLEEGRRIDAVVAETFRTERDAAIRERDEARDSNGYFERYLIVCRGRDAAIREADRWRHGQQIEGDYVCPDSLEVLRLTAELAAARAECERMRPVYESAVATTIGGRELLPLHLRPLRDAVDTALDAALSTSKEPTDGE